MRYVKTVLIMMLWGVTMTSCGEPPGVEEGVWQLTGITVNESGKVVAIENPGIARLILQNGQYSQIWMQSGRSYDDPPTNMEKIDSYDSFDASAGTYTFSNSTLTLTPNIAHDPNTIGQSTTTTVAINGDEVKRTRERANPDDPAQKIQWTSTYMRVK